MVGCIVVREHCVCETRHADIDGGAGSLIADDADVGPCGLRAPRLRLTERGAVRILVVEVKYLMHGGFVEIRYVPGFICGLALLLGWIESAAASADAAPYPAMAPFARYLETSASDEVALARSAARASISANAEVLTLKPNRAIARTGAIKGNNGFVCLVERSWARAFTDSEFWNPKFRSPICHNRAAARTVLPTLISEARTRWSSLRRLNIRDDGSHAGRAFRQTRSRCPKPGPMSYMMSKVRLS